MDIAYTHGYPFVYFQEIDFRHGYRMDTCTWGVDTSCQIKSQIFSEMGQKLLPGMKL